MLAHGISVASWNTYDIAAGRAAAGRPSTRTCPAEGRSRPAISLSTVDLAAARRPQQRNELAGGDRNREGLHRRHAGGKAFVDLGEFDRGGHRRTAQAVCAS
jgi:hypothetical protein